MQSCWEVDPAARPDMLKIQLAMRDMLPRVEHHPTAIAFRPSTSPVRIEPLLPTRVSPTIDGGSAHETNGSSPESSSSSIPLLKPPQPSGGQLTLELSPTMPSPRMSPLPELESTETLKKGTPDLISPRVPMRLPPLREGRYEPHSPGPIPSPIPMSKPRSKYRTTGKHPMEPQQFSRSSSRPSSVSTLASDFLGPTSPTSSDSNIFTVPSESDEEESVPPKRKLDRRFSKRTQSPFKSKSTTRVSSQTNLAETLRVGPSRLSTILPIITTIRQRVPVSEGVLHFLKNAASDPETLIRLARDGSVSAGNLEGLLNRAIVGSSDSFRDERFKATFLTIYQLFATSEQVFEILKKRFEATYVDPGPSMAGSQYS